eukprot:366523-Chlamydomonas_euryale.AAC.10
MPRVVMSKGGGGGSGVGRLQEGARRHGEGSLVGRGSNKGWERLGEGAKKVGRGWEREQKMLGEVGRGSKKGWERLGEGKGAWLGEGAKQGRKHLERSKRGVQEGTELCVGRRESIWRGGNVISVCVGGGKEGNKRRTWNGRWGGSQPVQCASQPIQYSCPASFDPRPVSYTFMTDAWKRAYALMMDVWKHARCPPRCLPTLSTPLRVAPHASITSSSTPTSHRPVHASPPTHTHTHTLSLYSSLFTLAFPDAITSISSAKSQSLQRAPLTRPGPGSTAHPGYQVAL